MNPAQQLKFQDRNSETTNKIGHQIVVSFLIPPLAPAMATIGAWPVMSMRWCVDWMNRWPGNEAPLRSPPMWLVVLFYALLLSFLIPIEKARVKKWVNRLIAVAMAVVVASPMLLAPQPHSQTSTGTASGRVRRCSGAGPRAAAPPPPTVRDATCRRSARSGR